MFRLIGINQDDRADGTGKAGLTFQATGSFLKGKMNGGDDWRGSNAGGWRDSMLRKNLNDESTGTIWNAIQSADFKNNITPVLKTTNNNSNNKGNSDNTSNASSITVDKLFILSPSEMGMPIIKNYETIDGYYINHSTNVHYYDSDSYKNTIKSDSNKTYAWFTFYNYIYSGNAYQWWMLPAGFRKMNNGNQAYHNTDSYNIYNIGDFYWLRSAYFAIIYIGGIWGINSRANNIGVVVSFSF